MTIAVKRYYSGMNPGAPALTGQEGTLVALLDACLKDGFNPKTVTLAQTAGTATATCAGHGFGVNDVVAISGASVSNPNESAWNDEFRVLTAATNSFTFAISAAAPSPVTSTPMTAKIAPLGWTKPYSGTNKAAYLPKVQYVQCYLRVQDNSSTPTSANGRWGKIRGYETMSDVDTGTGLFPTVAQMTNSLSLMKSSTSDSTARAWWLVGDGGIFYLGTFWQASTPTIAGVCCFGDPNSLRAGDAYSSFICGDATDTLPSSPGSYNVFATLTTYNNTQAGKYIARPYNQIGSSVAAAMMGNPSVFSYLGYSGFAYPYPVDNGLLFSPVALCESNLIRSRALPGLYQPLHATPLNYLETLTGISDLPGRTLQAFDMAYAYNRAQGLIDITGPWR